MNQNAISSAPCSFGILIDRGLGHRSNRTAINITLIFFGGPDDRESLALASRMAGHPNISLTLLRFIPCCISSSHPENDDENSPLSLPKHSIVNLSVLDNHELRYDETSLEEFKARWEGGDVRYIEKASSNAEETVQGIREMVEGAHDLYIVGRAHGRESSLTAGLTEWSECPELGAIGDLLSTSDFASRVSVLVVEQGKIAEGTTARTMAATTGGMDSPGKHVKLYVSKSGENW